LIDSGYAGIRLPNSAKSNIVENNFIENHGRGLFILSSSEDNIVRNNTVKNTSYQGVFIQSSGNVLEGNTIIDAGDEAIYVVNADAKSSPTPSIADNNRILGNVIYDTRKHDADRFIGLKILSRNNIVKGNRVSMTYGRKFKDVKADAGNQDIDNVYKKDVRHQRAR
jgi:parallel beta-helix repeat protein